MNVLQNATNMLAFLALVPEMIDPLGKHWDQPSRALMQLTSDGYVIMSKASFDELKDYSRTMPSGVYPGKMWKCQDEDGWHLCWYGIVEGNPDVCSNNNRPIILKEMIDLLET